MPNRAETNSAIVRCRTRVVPLRTVNERLNAMRRDQKSAGHDLFPEPSGDGTTDRARRAAHSGA
jgi:hypothetical protein